MRAVLTDWIVGTTPLRGRPGEYESLSGSFVMRRWWDGHSFSRPYRLANSPADIARARVAPAKGPVVWRGLSHRFVRNQKVRHGDRVHRVLDLRLTHAGWLYRVDGRAGHSQRWLHERTLAPVQREPSDRR